MCNVIFFPSKLFFFTLKYINFQKSSLILDMCLCKDVNAKQEKKNSNMNNVCHLIKINTKKKAFVFVFRGNVFRCFVFICEFSGFVYMGFLSAICLE